MTSNYDVFAAGEVTVRNGVSLLARRVEAWKLSSAHGTAAGQTMAGQITPFHETPSFWTDQYQHNLQVIGYPDSGVGVQRVVSVDPETWVLVAYDPEERVVGVVTLNHCRNASLIRRAIERGQKMNDFVGLLQ